MKTQKLLFLSSLFILGCNQQHQVAIQHLQAPSTALFQAVSMINENSIWVSGHQGSVIRSVDSGTTWDLYQFVNDSLEFRDIHGINAEKAVVMSAGPGSSSRIYTFQTPGTWKENFIMPDSLGFLDCMDFWDARGIAYGDAIDKYPYILLTRDGGDSWYRADTSNIPKAGIGEGGFAASGDCVTVQDGGKAWIATGAGGNARFLVSEDYGSTWKSISSPMVKGEAAGHTAVVFEGQTGFATGGDLMQADSYTDNCIFTENGGISWSLASKPNNTGAFYGADIVKTGNKHFTFICGPAGVEYSDNFENNWRTLDTLNFWAVDFYNNVGFASGTNGKILRLEIQN
ncbi:MAG: hypothetical protein AAF616_09565 [Bacteroidota bacterium]